MNFSVTKWTEDWPTEPGDYWFYGQPNVNFPTKEEEVYLVKVSKISNGLMFVTNNRWLYKTEAKGLWLPAELPRPY